MDLNKAPELDAVEFSDELSDEVLDRDGDITCTRASSTNGPRD